MTTFEYARTPAPAVDWRRGQPTERHVAKAKGSPTDPWVLKTPPGTSEFTMHREALNGTDILVCTVGKTVLHYEYRCIKDLHDM